MPQNGISLYFTIRDGGSQVLSAIGDKTKALNKETQSLAQAAKALQTANEPLIKQQTELRTALERAQKAVKDARTEYRRLGDEASENKLKGAIEEQEELRRSLRDVESQIKSNSKTYNEYRENLRKGSTSSGISSGSVASSVLSALGQAGIFAFLGDAASQWGTTLADSAFGEGAGSILSSALSGAGTGAAIGTMFSPAGTAVGAVLGGLVGGLTGSTQIYEQQDDAFKDYYGNLYDTVSEGTASRIESGSTIAGSREQTQMAFAQRLGSDAAAAEYLDQVRTMAARTNYGYDEIVGYSQLLLNSYSPEEVFAVLQSLSDATAGLNLSSSDVEMMIAGLSRMRTTGKATQEYLNYFSERGVDVYSALGEALGVDRSQVAGMVSDGDVSGEAAAEAILGYIDQQYGGLSEDLMGTYDAMVDNLADIMADIDARAGEGYNETRLEGIAAEQEAYGGALGEAVAFMGQIAGENQAFLENLSEQYQREALSAVLQGEDVSGSGIWSEEELAELASLREQYKEAVMAYANGSETAGLDMERLYEEAQALATIAYDNSDEVAALRDTELDQIEAIRESIIATDNLAGALSDYQISLERSIGQASTWFGRSAPTSGSATEMWGGDIEPGTMILDAGGQVVAAGYAVGLPRVPYDNFPALLHEGERVLTANEARAMDQTGGGVTIQVGELVVREEADVDRVAETLMAKLRLARMVV